MYSRMCIHKPRVHIGVTDNTGCFDVKIRSLGVDDSLDDGNDRDCLQLKQKTFVLHHHLNEITRSEKNSAKRREEDNVNLAYVTQSTIILFH